MARKEAVLALFEQRFDYYSARTVLGEALARAGLPDQDEYGHRELERLVEGLRSTGQGMLDRLIAGLRALEAPPPEIPVGTIPQAEPEPIAPEVPQESPEGEAATEEAPPEAPEEGAAEDHKPKKKKR